MYLFNAPKIFCFVKKYFTSKKELYAKVNSERHVSLVN